MLKAVRRKRGLGSQPDSTYVGEVQAAKNGLVDDDGLALSCSKTVFSGSRDYVGHQCNWQATGYQTHIEHLYTYDDAGVEILDAKGEHIYRKVVTRNPLCNMHLAAIERQKKNREAENTRWEARQAVDNELASRRQQAIARLKRLGFALEDYEVRANFSDVTIPLNVFLLLVETCEAIPADFDSMQPLTSLVGEPSGSAQ